MRIGLLTLQSIPGLYCVGDSSFPGQGVIAVAFSGIMCAHRVAADFGKLLSMPTFILDECFYTAVKMSCCSIIMLIFLIGLFFFQVLNLATPY